MDFYRHPFTKTEGTPTITMALVHIISILFTFQVLVTAYSSSTYIKQFLDEAQVGLMYSVGATIAIIISLILPRILRKIGNVMTTLFLSALICISLIVLGMAITPTLTVFAFIIYLAFTPQIYLNIDIFLETLIGKNENSTGSKRGMILALMSVAALLSPLAMGQIIGEENNLSAVYFVGAGVGLLFMTLVIARFRQFYDPPYKTILVRNMLKDAAKDVDVRTVMIAQFLLQFFFTWAVIYIPLFLANEVGLDWDVISKILASGLLAFVIFEYPIGYLADKKYGEKEMMAIGFVILALASASITVMASLGIISWMILMFISRIGASLVEVTTESYFFKHVEGDEPNLISLFRLMRPLANLTGALVGSISLLFLPFHLMFVVLGLIMTVGVFTTSRLTDTK